VRTYNKAKNLQDLLTIRIMNEENADSSKFFAQPFFVYLKLKNQQLFHNFILQLL